MGVVYMKLKESFFYTIREEIKDEESKSGKLLVKSGMIKKMGNGIYMYTPIGLKALQKIEQIVREEMNRAGAQELLMPSLLPEEVYVKSGRRAIFGNDMFALKDRYQRDYVLGPTHEELFVSIAKQKIKSYKDMPFNLYQIARKYRDEPRPRFGLIRIREFLMKDAYSFDRDLEGLEIAYQKMYQAYCNIYDRIGLDYRIVTADTGAMGGLLSEEFQAVTDIGEDTLVLCPKCHYASNIEVSVCSKNVLETKEALLEKELIFTPNAKTIAEVSEFLNEEPSKFVKTLIYKGNGQYYAVLVPGNREVNELKLSQLLNCEVSLASAEEVIAATSSMIGFVGPVGLNIPILVDQNVSVMHNFIVGANQESYHYKNVNMHDFTVTQIADLINVQEGDLCPNCHAQLYFKKGIEVGNLFKLGTKYSESLDLCYLDSTNQSKPVVMGCYGIGIERILAACVEQTSTNEQLYLPISIAPYTVGIVVVKDTDDVQMKLGLQLYESLTKQGIDTILDDRAERVGVKFNDMDLLGVPIRITVGKNAIENQVEWKTRGQESEFISVETVMDKIAQIVQR